MAKREIRTLFLLSLLPLLILLFIPARKLLHEKRTRDLGYAIRWQYSNRISALIANGADVNGRMPDGELFVEYAMKQNQFKIASQLLEAGARSTPVVDKLAHKKVLSDFYWAVYYNNAAEITRWAKLGYNGNTLRHEGTNFLMVAALHSQISTIQQLLRDGANPNAHDPRGYSVLWRALSRGWQSGPFVKVLLRAGAKPDANDRLLMAVHANDIVAARRALQSGANPNARDSDGCPLLSLSAGSAKMVALLLQSGANPNLKSVGETVLTIAKRGGPTSVHKSPRPDAAALTLLQRAATPRSNYSTATG